MSNPSEVLHFRTYDQRQTLKPSRYEVSNKPKQHIMGVFTYQYTDTNHPGLTFPHDKMVPWGVGCSNEVSNILQSLAQQLWCDEANIYIMADLIHLYGTGIPTTHIS